MQELLGGPARVYELSEYKLILEAKSRYETGWKRTMIENSNFPELNNKIMSRLKSKSNNFNFPSAVKPMFEGFISIKDIIFINDLV